MEKTLDSNILHNNIKESAENNKGLWIHIWLALPCLAMYFIGPEIVKYLLIPYPIILLFQKEAKYIPAIILHTLAGSSISYIILLACFFMAIYNYKYLVAYKVNYLFLIIALPMPYMLFNFYFRFMVLHLPLSDSLNPIQYYLGIFPFFYGVLVFRKMNREIVLALFYVFFLIMTMHTIRAFDFKYRITFALYPLFFSVFIIGFLKSYTNYFPRGIKLISYGAFFFFIIDIKDASLTLLLSIIVATLTIYRFKDSKILVLEKEKNFYKFGFPISVILILWLVIANSGIDSGQTNTAVLHQTWDITDLDQLFDRMIVKLTSDRMPLWKSVYKNTFVDYQLWFPPLILGEYWVEDNFGNYSEITYGAHNLFLELNRTNGILLGTLIFFIFSTMLVKGSQIFRLRMAKSYVTNHLIKMLYAAFLSAGFFGTLFGQYPLMVGVSFALLCFAGMSYGVFYDQVYNARMLERIKS
jgi:hypothetical protein